MRWIIMGWILIEKKTENQLISLIVIIGYMSYALVREEIKVLSLIIMLIYMSAIVITISIVILIDSNHKERKEKSRIREYILIVIIIGIVSRIAPGTSNTYQEEGYKGEMDEIRRVSEIMYISNSNVINIGLIMVYLIIVLIGVVRILSRKVS